MSPKILLVCCFAVLARAEPPVSSGYLPAGSMRSQNDNYAPPTARVSFNLFRSKGGSDGTGYGAPQSLPAVIDARSAQQSNFGSHSAPSSSYGSPSGFSSPSANYGAPGSFNPSSRYGAPNDYNNPSASYNPTANEHSAPPSTYGAPSDDFSSRQSSALSSYSRLSSKFGSAGNSFGASSAKFGPPSGSYGAPSSKFASPSNTYGAPTAKFGAQSGISTKYGAPNNGHSAPSSSYGAPSTRYGPASYNSNSLNTGYGAPMANSQDQDSHEPANYDFLYDVNGHEGTFGHKEEREGESAQGSYHVLLPDGRTQVVEYTADERGYKPVISYQEPEHGYPDARSGGPY